MEPELTQNAQEIPSSGRVLIEDWSFKKRRPLKGTDWREREELNGRPLEEQWDERHFILGECKEQMNSNWSEFNQKSIHNRTWKSNQLSHRSRSPVSKMASPQRKGIIKIPQPTQLYIIDIVEHYTTHRRYQRKKEGNRSKEHPNHAMKKGAKSRSPVWREPGEWKLAKSTMKHN
jgi:hypothetical protein